MQNTIVNYSSSEDDSPKDNSKPLKRKFPLPEEIKNMYHDKIVKHIDDPNLHYGRTRTFDHEVGNWSTLVSIPFEQDMEDLSHDMIKLLKIAGEFKLCPDLHLSLSRTVVLKHHWIDQLFEELKTKFCHLKKQRMKLYKIDVLPSIDNSRTFITLNLEAAFYNYTSTLVSVVDYVFDGYQLPPFYQPPIYHVSFLWCLGDVRDKIDAKLMAALQTLLDEASIEEPELFNISSNRISFKTGNKELFFNL